ncbi:Ig-like domain-containing protein [Chryseolinea sp. T2]|uniref:RCC1 domain-containing protein n=1 Tax=Chryseolinea sp. T2 TaxID=3129255 RepID=UPI0030773074
MKNSLFLLLLFVSCYVHAQCWQSVSAGVSHTVALRPDGSLWGWGFNGSSQLGDGSITYSQAAIRIGTASDWKLIDAGGNHTLAIKTDGTLWSWGENQWGQIGTGTVSSKVIIPSRRGTETNWKLVTAGRTFSLAIKTDGSLWAWGDNFYGQLGFAGTAFVPTRVGAASDWKLVSGGGNHTLAIRTDGSLWAWGSNLYGELGDGTIDNKSTPARIGTDTNWALVYAGYDFSAAIKTDGTLWVWGNNQMGQLGLGDYNERHIPTQVGTGNNWKSVDTGIDNMVAIKSDNTMWAWGWIIGKFGFGPSDNSRSLPTRIGLASDWTSVASGERHSFAFKTDGTLWGFGDNNWGEVGNGELGAIDVPKSVTTVAPAGASDQSFCSTATVANLDVTGTSVQWYLTPSGGTPVPQNMALTNGTHYYASQTIAGCESFVRLDVNVSINTTITPAPLGDAVQTLCAGSKLSALIVDGTDIKWYSAAVGGALLNPNVVLVDGMHYYASQTASSCESSDRLKVTFSQIVIPAPALNDFPVCEGTPIGYLVANVNWYSAPSGGTKLPLNTTIISGTTYYASQLAACGESTVRTPVVLTVKTTPAPVPLLGESWLSASAGSGNTMAIRSDGTLWVWGDEYVNPSSPTYRYVPRRTEIADDWLTVVTGGEWSMGLQRDGEMYYWNTGQLPAVKIGTAQDWASITTYGYAATYHSGAIKNDGTLWMWGSDNSVGQQGNGTFTAMSAPTRVGTDSDWKSVSNGYRFTIAIKTDGSLWAWGLNDKGQLGNGTNNNTRVPTRVGSDTDWAFVSSGGSSSVAIKNDGSLWTWGDNAFGQLGDGTTISKNRPVKIGTSLWQTAAVGGMHTLAIRQDGTLWGWGYDATGATGAGRYIGGNILTPKQAGSAANWKSVHGGGGHSVALAQDGRLWLWGSNDRGELGINKILPIEYDPLPLPAKQFTCGRKLTLAELPMQGINIKWYSWTTGEQVPSSYLLNDGSRFYATQTINGVESCKRAEVVGESGSATMAGSQQQTFCIGATVEDLKPSFDGVSWYESSSGGAPLNISDRLIDGKQYFASLLVGDCESTSLSVVVNLTDPGPPAGDALQILATGAKVEDLVPSGPGISWFEEDNGGLPLPVGHELVDGKIYYATQTVGACVSGSRLAVMVELTTPDVEEPVLISTVPANGASEVSTGTTFGFVFSEAVLLNTGTFRIFNATTDAEITSLQLTADNTSVTDAPVTITLPSALPPNTSLYVQLDNGTFVDLSGNAVPGISDKSWLFSTRPAVVICATEPPTGNATQQLPVGATVASLKATGNQIVWYDAATEGSVLVTSAVLINGAHYFATQAVDGCESTARLDVTVELVKSAQTITFENLPSKMVGDPSFQLNASASSGLPVVFTSSNEDVAEVDGSRVIIVGAGTTTITAAQNGNSTYSAALPVSRTLEIGSITAIGDESEHALKLYPNPAKENFMLKLPPDFSDGADIKIIAQDGRIIYQEYTHSSEMSITTSNFNNGVYMLVVSGTGKTSGLRIVINN